jgi:hypothetical protein
MPLMERRQAVFRTVRLAADKGRIKVLLTEYFLPKTPNGNSLSR